MNDKITGQKTTGKQNTYIVSKDPLIIEFLVITKVKKIPLQ